ncbi:MAG: tRNA (adenosine(37)-N6)-threonylcarbamoyltransferase complex transferase subunit TsaD [Candidatus Omnitrophica bacterium]|nr:tRNA (adenosine(37)-N6)-threonylcarbamoyltransferase complex transferase subunit TsaD [Candidatus Omnitrophota bacterium]
MITLGIETSCDETGIAIVDNGKKLSNVVSSSIHLHSQYGGVVPEIASRYHLEYIDSAIKQAIERSGKQLTDIELIAVTYGPGLCGSLLTGISYAKALGFGLSIPVLGINHLAAHIYANFLTKDDDRSLEYPFISLIVSGGHTSIVLCNSPMEHEILGQTQDDAIGEAFDKVSKIMGLGYPGGPIVEKRAYLHNGKDNIKFPRAFLNKNSLDFSFSGIKTAVLYFCKDKNLTDELINDICFAFQESVFEVVTKKAVDACLKAGIKTLCIGGGVAANKTLYNKLLKDCTEKGIKFFKPSMEFCLDNGAMVAALGEKLYIMGQRSPLDFTAEPGLGL